MVLVKTFGLQVSPSESSLFLGRVRDDVRQAILQVLDMLQGSFPVSYLGIPLTTRKLRYGECKGLMERIIARVTHWSSKTLIYAGRLQLINSIVASLHSY